MAASISFVTAPPDHGRVPPSMPPVRLGSFGPDGVARMIEAYGAAVAIAEDRSGPFALPASEMLHRLVAETILREARAGVDDVDRLRAAALRAVGRDAAAMDVRRGP